MANRQIIPVEKVVKCHVNSNDSSPTYEAGTAYAAGTLVNYNGDSYTSIIDIEDTDSDTPADAPEKWALTPNAFRSNGDSGLTEKVTAIEDAIDTMKVLKTTGLCEVTASADTGASLCAKLVAAMNEIVAALADDETLEIVSLEGSYSGVPLNRYTYKNNQPVSALNILGGAFTDSWATTCINLIHIATNESDVKWLRTDLKSTPVYNQDYAANNFTDGYKLSFRYHIYKTIDLS